jgi:hypothetical protein
VGTLTRHASGVSALQHYATPDWLLFTEGRDALGRMETVARIATVALNPIQHHERLSMYGVRVSRRLLGREPAPLAQLTQFSQCDGSALSAPRGPDPANPLFLPVD